MSVALRITPYTLALARDWASARGGFVQRRGWLVRASAGGVSGWGECAPLPAAGTEQADVAEAALARVLGAAGALGAEALLDRLEALTLAAPAARHGVESALLDLIARRRGLTLRALLDPAAPARVEVNAVLGALDDDPASALNAAAARGARVFKLKLGVAEPRTERARLRELAHHLPPRTRLRLDANGAWDAATAATMIETCRTLPVESLEEPLREPDPTTLAALQARAPFALALDESLAGPLAGLAPERLGVRRLVLKPAVLGGPRATRALAEHARAAGLEVVLTSVVESAAGLWIDAQLAAALAPAQTHGLDTAAWLAEDLGVAPSPREGVITLPETPGSGFTPFPAAAP
ncbi:o-succinylbenzoate synthase [Marichromatium bheemlicum]|uniref:o-succinylbenzoate synthase n=1 Tax=Marichromatium bheemlicum TaxID=365339 RepID=A0ABX1I542_9GAMM|nr:o-succinylbenzoate synthase [Marichromatium bheemlicum]NKN32251.1 o-succinylbenzoate synthase [Marichromatium bheemlicum]